MNNLKSDVFKLINRFGLLEQYVLFTLQDSWSVVVGEYLAKSSMPQYIKQGELLIHTNSSIISSSMYFMQNELKSRMEELFKPLKISKINIKVGRMKPLADTSNDGSADDNKFVLDETTDLQDEDLIFISSFSSQFKNSDIYGDARRIAYKYAKIRRQKINSGWNKCSVCGALIRQGTDCLACRLENDIVLRHAVRELLTSNPEADYRIIRDKIVISQKRFNFERELFIQDLADNKVRDAR